MATLHWTTNERSGTDGNITLVELVVENSAAIPVRIRVGNRLDGEIQSPRRCGVPEAGWDEGGFEGIVGAGERRALGYAVPTDSDSDSPPAEIVWTERAPETEESTAIRATSPGPNGKLDIEPTAAGVVRALGDARPPVDAVPTPYGTELPDAVETWLSAVEARIERYEANDGEMRTKTAAEQTEEQELARRVAADRRTLDSVARRIDGLRERVDSTRKPDAIGETI